MDRKFVAECVYVIANALCLCAVLPQILKIIKTKSAKDLSIIMILMYTVANILFIVFGLLIKSIPMASTNLILLLLTAWELILKLKYDGKFFNRKNSNV
jgi:MtN3 and saliva related transmembrane protein